MNTKMNTKMSVSNEIEYKQLPQVSMLEKVVNTITAVKVRVLRIFSTYEWPVEDISSDS